MNFSIALSESDLRAMPPDLRDHLLKWYFDRSPFGNGSPSAHPADRALLAITAVPRREDSGRVTFPELARAGLLMPGDEIVCRALKRQRRGGEDPVIEAGKVLEDGSVEYRSRRHDTPSKLARTVINTNGGETAAVNGYDYLFVRSSSGLVPLSNLRDRFFCVQRG